jgi:hypothetical protein
MPSRSPRIERSTAGATSGATQAGTPRRSARLRTLLTQRHERMFVVTRTTVQVQAVAPSRIGRPANIGVACAPTTAPDAGGLWAGGFRPPSARPTTVVPKGMDCPARPPRAATSNIPDTSGDHFG